MLKRTNDRKTANAVNRAGTQSVIANAFSIPSGVNYSCPGATTFCTKICYAGKLEKMYPSFRRVVIENFENLLYAEYLGGVSEMQALIHEMIVAFVADCDKRNASKDFRIHADGDFFSRGYAQAWVNVINDFPEVNFWVYTRSFTEVNVLDILDGVSNLTVYLSADVDNLSQVTEVSSVYPSMFVATVADTFAEARNAIVDTAGRKVYACPENGKRIPLIDKKGSACIRCGVCVKGRGDVLFSVKKR